MKAVYNKEKTETQVIVIEPATITIELTLCEAAAVAAAIADVDNAKLSKLLYVADTSIRKHSRDAIKSLALHTLYSSLIDFLKK